MTDVHSQYRTHASNMRTITGLGTNEVGVAPDQDHLKNGGYHCGCRDIINIGRWDLDYSTRQPRDRKDRTSNWASAVDIGDDWPNGGRAAWLRWNNMLLRQLQLGDPALAAIRAINFSPDGVERKRFDTNNRAQGVIDSTDSVYMHTHTEPWRDQVGQPALDRAFRRIEQIARAAIANRPLEEEMPLSSEDVDKVWDELIPQQSWDAVPAEWGASPAGDPLSGRAMLGGLHRRVHLLEQGMLATYNLLKASAAADETRDRATQAAIEAIVSHGGPEAAPIIEAINAATAETHDTITQLQDELADERAETARLRRAIAEAFNATQPPA